MAEDVSSAQFWNERYLKKETGWDVGACSPPIARLLREGHAPKAGRLAVIGAGRGHEAIEAARLGFRVAAIDFSDEACRAATAGAEAAGVSIEALEEDLFLLPRRRPGHYDAVIEQTCFCAVAVERRAEYVEAVYGLLKPKGVLFGLFYAHGNPGGPPFDTNEAELLRLFSPRFELTRLVRAADSVAQRAGKELEAVFTRK